MSPLQNSTIREAPTTCQSKRRRATTGLTEGFRSSCTSKTTSSAQWSHNIKPGRRRRQRRLPSLNSLSGRTTSQVSLLRTLLTIILTLTLWCGTSAAGTSTGKKYWETDEFVSYAQRGQILVDQRPPPAAVRDQALYRREYGFGVVVPRQNVGDPFASTTDLPSPSSASSASSPSSTTVGGSQISSSSSVPRTLVVSTTTATPVKPSKSSSVSPQASTTLMTTPGSDLNSPLPKPFDTSLGSNFTSSACPDFFNSFLNNSTFQSCLPFSTLLLVSPSLHLHIPPLLTHSELQLLLPSLPLHNPHDPNPGRNLLRALPHLQRPPLFSRNRAPLPQHLRPRLLPAKQSRPTSRIRLPRLRPPLPGLLPQSLSLRGLLFRIRHNQHQLAVRRVRVLPPAGDPIAREFEADV